MKLVITYDSDMKSNFDDVRFFDESTKWEIPYFLESKTDSTTATVWIKTGNNNTISLYYGNAAAGSGSNGAMVFDLFDDFDSLANWSVVGGTVSASSGIATIDTVGSATLYRNYNFPYPYIAETRYQYQTPNSYRNRLAITTSAGTGSPTGFDYGLFSNGTNHQLYWNGWTGTALTINVLGNDSDPNGDVWTYMPYGPWQSFEQFEAWLKEREASRDPWFYAFIRRDTGKACGMSGLF